MNEHSLSFDLFFHHILYKTALSKSEILKITSEIARPVKETWRNDLNKIRSRFTRKNSYFMPMSSFFKNP